MDPRARRRDERSAREDLDHARRDIRGLFVLESIHRACALVALVGVAVRGALHADRRGAIGAGVAVVLSLASLALAFRLRMGQEHLRRDIVALELREELEARARELALDADPRSSPYRQGRAADSPRASRRRGRLGRVIHAIVGRARSD